MLAFIYLSVPLRAHLYSPWRTHTARLIQEKEWFSHEFTGEDKEILGLLSFFQNVQKKRADSRAAEERRGKPLLGEYGSVVVSSPAK